NLAAQRNQRIATTGMRTCKIRRDRNRAFEARQRIVELAGARQRHAEEEMRACPARIDREHLACISDPLGQAPFLTGSERKPMELIGLAWPIHGVPPEKPADDMFSRTRICGYRVAKPRGTLCPDFPFRRSRTV